MAADFDATSTNIQTDNDFGDNYSAKIDGDQNEEDDDDELSNQQQQQSSTTVIQRSRFDFCDLCFGVTGRIPTKSFNLDRGLFVNERVVTTCLDADDEQIAVGSNVGQIFIFNRRLRKMFTVKGKDAIECLKLSNNGEYTVLGIGLETGVFVVVQLPSSGVGKSRKLQEKVIPDVHKSKITCLEWSADGRKLFTGDAAGLIMMTLVDFENRVHDSSFVYCDPDHFPITQLAYWGNFLAISTLAQTFLIDIADDCRVRSIGHQSRKSIPTHSGVAFVRKTEHEDDGKSDLRPPRLYVSRAACRLWRVDLPESKSNGDAGEEPMTTLDVKETQDYLHSMSTTDSFPIPVELQRGSDSKTPPCGFGRLYRMDEDRIRKTSDDRDEFENLLVTHDDYHLFFIDVRQRVLIGWTQFRLKITDVAVSSRTKEIFVLFCSSSWESSSPWILRIGVSFADPWLVTAPVEDKSMMKKSTTDDSINALASSSVKGFLQKLKTTSSDLVNKSADVLGAAKDLDTSAPNFQIFLNKIRASSSEPSNEIGMGLMTNSMVDDFEDRTQASVAGFSTSSRPSTPDTMSLASGVDGIALPPWCLEDQSLTENPSAVISRHVNVTKSKRPRRRHISRTTEKRNLDLKMALEATPKYSTPAEKDGTITNNKEQQLTISTNNDDRLSTPTEEKFALNRFNPFDELSASKSPAFTREQMEQMLDSTFLRQESSKLQEDGNVANGGVVEIIEPIEETVVRDKTESFASIDEASLRSSVSADLKKLAETAPPTPIKPAIPTSFRELLMNETRAAGGEDDAEPESPQPAIRRQTTTVDSLTSPDDIHDDQYSPGATSGRDTWCQVNHDRPIVYISGCSHYFAFIDVDQTCRYFSYTKNHAVNGDLLSTTDHGKKDGAWSTLSEKCDSFAVSPSSRIVWRVLDETAYGRHRPTLHGPLGGRWFEAGKDVSAKVAVSNSSAWYIKTDGMICAQTQLRPDRPCFKIVHIECEWPLVQLACTDDVVWGLRHDGRLVVRIGIKLPDCPTGADWIDFVPDGPSEIVALDLYEETAWVVDTEGRLWFCRGVTNKHPIGTTSRWWQVALPAALSSNSVANAKRRTLPHAVCVTPVGIHMAVDRSIWYSRGGVTGHRWSRVIPIELEEVAQFRRLWTSCVFDEMTDFVWLIRLNNEFMAYQPHSRRLQSLVAPCLDSEIVAICGALGYVWTLDESGRIFIRSGIDPVHCPLGTRWQLLDMTQFDDGIGNDDSIAFVHISCSLDSVWACDQSGLVYARLGVAPLESTGLTSAWVRLDENDDYEEQVRKRRPSFSRPKKKRRRMVVRKLYCTPDGAAVWALTRGGRIFVRLGITDDVPIGKKWTELEDMRARSLAVGCDCAWALSEDFELFQRYGISGENPAGNFWKPLSHKLRSVAVTPNGKLWGLDTDQRLVRHQTKIYVNSESGSSKKDEAGNSSSSTESNAEHDHDEYLAELNDFEVV